MYPVPGLNTSFRELTPASDRQIEREQLRKNLNELRTTTTRMYSILRDFEELTRRAELSIQSSYALHREINVTAERLGLPPLRSWQIEPLTKRAQR